MLKEEVLKAKQNAEFEQKISNINDKFLNINKNVNYLVKWHNKFNPFLEKLQKEKQEQDKNFLLKYTHYFLHLLLLGMMLFISYLFVNEIHNLKAENEIANKKIIAIQTKLDEVVNNIPKKTNKK